jgi:hypothetical protein
MFQRSLIGWARRAGLECVDEPFTQVIHVRVKLAAIQEAWCMAGRTRRVMVSRKRVLCCTGYQVREGVDRYCTCEVEQEGYRLPRSLTT